MAGLFGAGMTACLTCIDLAIKSKIEEDWKPGEEKKIADSKVVIRKVHNKGMCLNVLEQHPEMVRTSSLLVTGVLTLYQLIFLRKKGHIVRKAGLSLTIAGAWSNTIDRWMRGYVVDYVGFQTKWEKLTKVTYNLGDFCIAAGSILLVLTEVFHKKSK